MTRRLFPKQAAASRELRRPGVKTKRSRKPEQDASIGCLDAATILEPPAVDLLFLNYGSLRAPVARNCRIMRLPAVSLILTDGGGRRHLQS
ncbi:hypothetical protein V5799_006209 [Amblyomma americanum]|uniref:Uncharacterized protein n=1 Tax=Amblyomma americanum TaxID=6943 RepID=A0AAQ4DX23_AMBAM